MNFYRLSAVVPSPSRGLFLASEAKEKRSQNEGRAKDERTTIEETSPLFQYFKRKDTKLS